MQSKLNTQNAPVFIRSELVLSDSWDTARIRALIERKTAAGRKPAFLFLGNREAEMLRQHLGAAFGPESVQTLNNLYYMGLEVIELDTWSFLRTAGMKRVQAFRDRRGRHPKSKDIDSLWHFEAV